MWQAKIAEKNYKNGSLEVNVYFSNGVDGLNEIYSIFSAEELSRRVQSRLDQLENTQTESSAIILGAFTPAKTASVQPSAEQLDFQNKYLILQRLKRAVDLGIIFETDAIYKTALSAAIAAFQDTFVNLL